MTDTRPQPRQIVATVEDPGPLTLFVDTGRFGWAHLAVPSSGPYDRASFRRANRLVGNYPDNACLEIQLGPFTVRFIEAATVALTGVITTMATSTPSPSSAVPRRDHQRRSYSSETTLSVAAGTIVEIDRFHSGVRGYFAIRGGWSGPTTLGSLSSDTLSGLGPHPLHTAQRLQRGSAIAAVPQDEGRILTLHNKHTVMIDRSPLWSPAAFDWLLSTSWQVSPDSDRIGLRLVPTPSAPASDPPPAPATSHSVPLVRGAVQVPPSGSPVIMGPDHPTTGGYPVAAVVTKSSSDALGQARPGDSVTFKPSPNTG